MVARTASPADGAASRVAVTFDGSLATVFESSRVTVLALPDGTAFAEIGVDPDAVASEVAWLGSPPRLLVLSRYPAHSTAHLLDPHGPRTIAEIRLDSPVRLYTTVGAAALVLGALGPAILVAGDAHLALYPFPSRVTPLAAGAAANQFVVALPSAIEEWDPVSRTPRRRLRLPRAAAITGVGGSDRLVWMTTQQEPSRIDVIPLVNRGQPRAHELPEPIQSIAGHPKSDLIACIGAETGQLYVIDLDGRMRMRTLDPDALDRVESAALVVGRTTSVLASHAGHQLAMLSLDGRDPLLEAARPTAAAPPAAPEAEVAADASATDEPSADHRAPMTDADDRAPMADADGRTPMADADGRAPMPTADADDRAPMPTVDADGRTPMADADGRAPMTDADDRAPMADADSRAPLPIAGDRAPIPGAPTAPAAPSAMFGRRAPPSAPPAPAASRASHRRSWRDDVVAWSRGFAAGTTDARPPIAPVFELLAQRFDLSPSLLPVLTLLYAAHLCGERGAAPVDVARVLDGQWDEALGRGELAARNVVYHAASRVALSPLVLRVLDELSPATGVLVGRPGPHTLLGPCVAVAGDDEPLARLAERCLAGVGGAILAAHGDAEPAAVLFEARAWGAVAMLRAPSAAPPREPAIFVVDDAELAEQLGVPRLA